MKCADCPRVSPVGVVFSVTLPNGRVVEWRLCRVCFIRARAAEVSNG